jgi:hypothetical protein
MAISFTLNEADLWKAVWVTFKLELLKLDVQAKPRNSLCASDNLINLTAFSCLHSAYRVFFKAPIRYSLCCKYLNC